MSVDWLLESITADGFRATHPIDKLPFTVGRDPGNDLVVESRALSKRHARFDRDADGHHLCLTDNGSTNGTFVNRERIDAPRRLEENDVIHFGRAEYRLAMRTISVVSEAAPEDEDEQRTLMVRSALSQHFEPRERQFMELLSGDRWLSAAAQPIVDAGSGRIYAYELLGRCTHPDLPTSPIQLFHLAARLELEAELSEAFRSYGVAAIAPRLKGARLFVNTHPKETFADAFFAALKRLRAQHGEPELVVEVHETAVLEVERMRELKQRLEEIGVSLAYDDFGAGQWTLNELCNVLCDLPPHFVKFDMALVHDIHVANVKKQRVVRDMVKLVLELGSVPLAEGVELDAEAAVCREMGFQLIQGYLTGRPVSLQSI